NTSDKRVFATGLNDCGQLGVSDVNTHALEPLEVSGIENDILHISAGYNHSAAVTGKYKHSVLHYIVMELIHDLLHAKHDLLVQYCMLFLLSHIFF
ncbi:hypothetical protein HID58_006842, partial [Brassica napus]